MPSCEFFPPPPDTTSTPLVVDAEGPAVRHFRSTRSLLAMYAIDLRGLDELSSLGSAQLSAEGWRAPRRTLEAQVAGDVHVVDLRHEPYGFLNDIA